MFQYLKYLGMLAAFKDVSKAYREEQGKDKPAWLSRRVIGAVVMFASVFIAIQFGLEIPEVDLNAIADQVEIVASALAAVYGAVLALVGFVKRYFPRKKGAPSA